MARRHLRAVRIATAFALTLMAGATVAADVSQDRRETLLYLLRHDCGSCHGMTLRGGLGPPLTRASLDGKPPELLQAVILYGRPGTPMPPWRALLSEADVRWLVRALKSGNLE